MPTPRLPAPHCPHDRCSPNRQRRRCHRQPSKQPRHRVPRLVRPPPAKSTRRSRTHTGTDPAPPLNVQLRTRRPPRPRNPLPCRQCPLFRRSQPSLHTPPHRPLPYVAGRDGPAGSAAVPGAAEPRRADGGLVGLPDRWAQPRCAGPAAREHGRRTARAGPLGARCGWGRWGRVRTARSAPRPGAAAGQDPHSSSGRPGAARPSVSHRGGERSEDRLQLGAGNRLTSGALGTDAGREPHRRGHAGFNAVCAAGLLEDLLISGGAASG